MYAEVFDLHMSENAAVKRVFIHPKAKSQTTPAIQTQQGEKLEPEQLLANVAICGEHLAEKAKRRKLDDEALKSN